MLLPEVVDVAYIESNEALNPCSPNGSVEIALPKKTDARTVSLQYQTIENKNVNKKAVLALGIAILMKILIVFAPSICEASITL